MIKTLKTLFKQDREKFIVPKSVQAVIPLKTMWEDGIFLVGRNKYAKTFKFEDINYAVASREDKEAMFLEYSELLNALDSGATTKITINNRRLNKADFEQTILIPMVEDDLDKYRKEYNKMLLDKATGANSTVQDKYVTVSVCKKNIEEARNYFARVGADLIGHFNRLGSKCTELDANDKLRIFHDFYRTGEETAFSFDMAQAMRKGHDFKDYICPDSFEFEKDYFKMGNRYGRVIFLREYAAYTLTMDGELLLVVLSSVAQQEVENISSNVKKGLKMKMQRGELVGFQGCLGYDYHKDTKSISVNEKEAEIVRYIFNRYIEGAGCTVIGNELENLGYKTKYGSSKWVQSTVIGIIKNEKYKGDLLLGKTFTVDPISKRRLENFGEEDKFYIRDHHEPIISEEIFEEAQKILAKRNTNRNVHQEGQKRNKFSRKYAFSCMIKCGFCGGTLTRRNWHSSSAYTKTIWQCVTATKNGKRHCPHCKGIPEEVIENAFVKSYQLLCTDQQEIVDEFLQKVEGILNDDTSLKRLPKIEKEMADLHRRKEKLLDLRLDNNIDRDIYEKKNQELSEQLKKLQEEQERLMELGRNQDNTRTRLREFRKVLGSGEILENFDRVVFESVVEKIVIGGYNDEGVEEPLKITFVYKTGIHSNFNGKDFKPKRKNAAAVHNDAELCSYTSDEAEKLCLHSSSDTCGDCVSLEQPKI